MGTSEKIAGVLQRCCPAFRRDNGMGGVLWHHCYCLAQSSNNESLASCDCVWHVTDTCEAGTWPQLEFVHKKAEEHEQIAKSWLEKAKAAIKNCE